MTTEEKIRKLTAACTDYRGKFHPVTKAWIVRPKPLARGRVEKWLAELGRDPAADIPRIDAFRTFQEFYQLLAEIRQDIAKRNQPAEVEL
jgi:hypothetical protein